MRPALEELSAARHGVLTRAELLAAGWSRQALDHAIASRRLHPVHVGVYAVGSPRLTADGIAMAAALTAGDDGGLAAESAAHLWEVRASRSTYWRTITRSTAGRARPQIKRHRAPGLRDDELTTLRGIPITSPARTFLDMATRVRGRPLMRALDQAQAIGRFDLRALEVVLRRHPRHRGATALRAALAELAPEPELTRSDKETAFLAIVDAHGLPRPSVNVAVGEFTVDFLFARERVIVEVDAGPWHTTPGARLRDQERDRVLNVGGYVVLRFSGRQVTDGHAGVAAAVRRTLIDRRT